MFIESIEAVQGNKTAAVPPSLSSSPSPSSAAVSQMEGIRDMLQQMAIESAPSSSSSDLHSSGGGADPKRALMAAIANSALKKENKRKEAALADVRNEETRNDLNTNTIPVLQQLLTLVQQQHEEIAALRASMQRLEAVCEEVKRAVCGGQSGD